MNNFVPSQYAANSFIDTLLGSDHANKRLYAIVDAAQNELIYTKIKCEADIYLSLYGNDVAESLKAVGPILFQLRKDNDLSSWLIDNGRDHNWFILFASTGTTMVDLRRHFKRFAMVQSPNGNSMYFRYYDPRVLRSYIPSCSEEERAFIYAQHPCFWALTDSNGNYQQFNRDGSSTIIHFKNRSSVFVTDTETDSLKPKIA